MLPPAERLAGMKLDNGWTVLSAIPIDPQATGGYFSKCYIVEGSDGKRAFLKALDYSKALQAADPAKILQAMAEAFNFERNILKKCKDENLDRVVIALDDGLVRFDSGFGGDVVQYLIFELADSDVRRQANVNAQFDLAWSLRSLHHIATGLKQLHTHGIAHQDLKPSNVLVFKNKTSKISDFGRSAYNSHISPFDEYPVPGDFTYAPPELLYNYVDPDWKIRRFGCDAYLLGSMTVFFFLGVGMTSLLQKELPDPFWWRNWTGNFDEVLPYLKDAFQRVLEYYRQELPDSLQNSLTEIVSQLCEPDPRMRGNIKDIQASNQFSLERYISRFNYLAREAELGLINLLPK